MRAEQREGTLTSILILNYGQRCIFYHHRLHVGRDFVEDHERLHLFLTLHQLFPLPDRPADRHLRLQIAKQNHFVVPQLVIS